MKTTKQDKAPKQREWVEGTIQEFLNLSQADMELIKIRLKTKDLIPNKTNSYTAS